MFWVFTASPFLTRTKRKGIPLGFACQAFWYKSTSQWFTVWSNHKAFTECCSLTHTNECSLCPSKNITNIQETSRELTHLLFITNSTTAYIAGVQCNLNLTKIFNKIEISVQWNCTYRPRLIIGWEKAREGVMQGPGLNLRILCKATGWWLEKQRNDPKQSCF